MLCKRIFCPPTYNIILTNCTHGPSRGEGIEESGNRIRQRLSNYVFIVYNCVYSISVLGPGKARLENRAQTHHSVIPCYKNSRMLYNISHELLYSFRFAAAIMTSSLVSVGTVCGRPELYLTKMLLQPYSV